VACRNGFNPRAREGRDCLPLALPLALMMFQSTRPGRARLVVEKDSDSIWTVSIHAPGKGATSLDVADEGKDKFQSTRPGRARLRF